MSAISDTTGTKIFINEAEPNDIAKYCQIMGIVVCDLMTSGRKINRNAILCKLASKRERARDRDEARIYYRLIKELNKQQVMVNHCLTCVRRSVLSRYGVRKAGGFTGQTASSPDRHLPLYPPLFLYCCIAIPSSSYQPDAMSGEARVVQHTSGQSIEDNH